MKCLTEVQQYNTPYSTLNVPLQPQKRSLYLMDLYYLSWLKYITFFCQNYLQINRYFLTESSCLFLILTVIHLLFIFHIQCWHNTGYGLDIMMSKVV